VKGGIPDYPEQESEKKLIAQELHDGLGGFLAAIKYSLEKNLGQLQKNKEGTDILLNEAIPLVQSAIEETRRISTNLWPSVLDNLGIIASIASACSDFEKTYTNIEVEKQVDVLEHEISPPLKIAIYRILQEALHNVAKHSKADRVKLCLSKRNDIIELLIEDNGCGFDPARKNKNTLGGMGLLSMRNRAQVCGGSLSLDNLAGGGALVRFVCPCQ
jgi:signal transduction histidine kinase